MDSSNHSINIIFAISLLVLAAISSLLYIPSLPMMAESFHVVPKLVQYSVSIGMASLCIGQLIFGPLSDHFGRKPITIIALFIFLVGSVIIVSTHSIEGLLIGRTVQGIGIGCSGTIPFAIMRDMHNEKALLRTMSYLSIAMAITPFCAPLVGGYIQRYFSWEMNFNVILLLSIFIFLSAILLFKESNTNIRQATFSLKPILIDYVRITCTPHFLGFVLASTFIYAGKISFNVVATFLFQKEMHYSVTTYSWFSSSVIIGFILGSAITTRLSKRLTNKKVLLIGTVIATVAALAMLVPAMLNILNVYTLMLPMYLYMLAGGILAPACFAGAIQSFKHVSGTASAMQGAINTFIVAIISAAVADLGSQSQLPLSIVLVLCCIVTGILYFTLLRKEK